MNSQSFYNYVLERFHNPDPVIAKKNRNKKTVLFADIITNINQLVENKNANPASARINQRNLRRLIGMLGDNQRKLIILRLLVYLYLAPFLRYSAVVFLVLFRIYHAHHPEFITARLNNSTMMAGFWSNYRLPINNNPYQSPHQLFNYDYSSSVPKSLTNIASRKKYRDVVITNGIVSIRNELNQVQRELYNTYNRSQYLGLTKPNPVKANSANPSPVNANPVKPKATTQNKKAKASILDQVIISKPMQNAPITKTSSTYANQLLGNKLPINKQNGKKTKKYGNYEKGYKFRDDYITGYILPEKGVAVIIEDGQVYLYKLPKYLIDEYVAMSNQH